MTDDPDHRSAKAPPVSRRSFLTAAAVGGATVAGLAFTGRPEAQPVSNSGTNSTGSGGTAVGPRIRRNIYALATTPEGRQTIESYRRGVAAMMAKPFSDVTSWRFQAAIHGINDETQQDLDDFNALPPELQLFLDPANLCNHTAFFFTAWHRMYVHYFERIVRKASGDPAFSLPYWNYSDSTAERILPEAFRLPADEATNALYRARRDTAVNTGTGLPAGVVSTTAAMATRRAIATATEQGFYEVLDGRPHGLVHVAIAGRDPVTNRRGLMGTFETAALDPIFWLHHCNIDRLWARWIREGNSDPNDAPFLAQSYNFWDEDGNRVSMTVADILDTAATLDYRYDDAGPEAGIVLAGDGGLESGRVPTTLAATSGIVALGLSPVAVTADPLVEAGGTTLFLTDPFVPGQTRLRLVLEGIRYDAEPGVLFQVYLNHPEGTPFAEEAPSYAGVFAPFGTQAEGETGTERFDISRLLNRQIASGIFDGGSIRIDIVPFTVAGLPAGVEAGTLPEVTIDRITIER